MKQTQIWVLVTGVVLSVAGVFAQPRDGRPGRREEPPSEGFWPTQRMIDIAIERMLREMAREYGFDEDQVDQTREVLHNRLPTWLQENRAELQSLLNEYMEVMMGLEPPAPEEMALWSQRALPLLDDLNNVIEQTSEDMRAYMTDEQQILLEGNLAAMRVGLNYMQRRLEVWQDGGYDRYEDWPHGEEYRRREREREERLRAEAEREKREAMGLPPDASVAAEGPPPDRPGERPAPAAGAKRGPTDEWVEYVENFIRRYDLDAAQQNSARKFLRTQQELRDTYLRKHLAEINAVEEQFQKARTDAEREKVRSELTRLNQPIDRYFQRLKDRLDTLPTRKQRAAAAQADLAARAKTESPEKARRTVESQPATQGNRD